MKYYLAIDIGASSGRHILGHQENEKLILEEIYRFENGPVEATAIGNIITQMMFDQKLSIANVKVNR